MQFRVSPREGAPLYRQIIDQVRYQVASGRLEPGDELPPVRVLAEQLLINPNTVARAYRELELSGVVTTRQGAGTYISNAASPLSRRERRRLVSQRAEALIVEARQMGFDLEETLAIVRERDKEIGSRKRVERK